MPPFGRGQYVALVVATPIGIATSVIASFAMAPVLTVPVLAYLRLKRNFTAD